MRRRAQVPRPGPNDPSLGRTTWTRAHRSRTIGAHNTGRLSDRPPPHPPPGGSGTTHGWEGGAHHE